MMMNDDGRERKREGKGNGEERRDTIVRTN